MDKPIVFDNKPVSSKVLAGEEYYFCTCGRSSTQPFCDGSHAGTSFTPRAFTAEKSETASFCQCKHSANAPFCDGSHSRFSASEVGHPGDGVIARVEGMPVATPTPEEPTVAFIHQLADEGLRELGHHGPMAAMGVPRKDLPDWDDLQVMVAQFSPKPLMEYEPVGTELVIGPEARKPLVLNIPLFVSDMSFGALSEEAKVAMARGAELAGTGICSGEGGMLPDEQQANCHYFYELASAQFGYKEALLEQVQAFHFKGGQGAKTGTGGHLPGAKNVGRIAEVRGIEAGQAAISPPTFADLNSAEDFARFSDRVRERSGGIPVGFKLSANHIERDIQFALDAGADYLILDGRGGGTGAAPLMFRDHISVPTVPALARARRYMDKQGASGRVTLIITGGLRTHVDFVKAMALGADGVALANSAMQAIGCVGARMCDTNNCPAGIATQKPKLRARLNVDEAARRLERYLRASVELMQVMARACGHKQLCEFNPNDLATWKEDMARLCGVRYSGVQSV